jgi:hypothetical protein
MILDFGFWILDWMPEGFRDAFCMRGLFAGIWPVSGNPAGRSNDDSSPANFLQSAIANQKSKIRRFAS